MQKKLDNQSIENSILQVKDSMNRLKETIQNSNRYSKNNIFSNNSNTFLNDSVSINSKVSEYKKSKNLNLYNYIDSSKKLNTKGKKNNNINKNKVNNSHLTQVNYTNRNKNNLLKAFNTESNFNKNQPKKYSNILSKNNTNNNKLNRNNNKITDQKLKNKVTKNNKINNSNYLSNIYKPKKISKLNTTTRQYNTNSLPLSFNHTTIQTAPNNMIKKNKNYDELYKYGEYLNQELKISNDSNTELLENYINMVSKLKLKNEENKKINNKIKKLTEEEKKLNKANEELKQNFSNVENIIEKNTLSVKADILEAQKNIQLNKNKITELTEQNLNLHQTQKIYENQIRELEKILYEYNNQKIEEKYISDNNLKKGMNEEKDILNQLDELRIRNSILQKEIENLENENLNMGYIIKDNNLTSFNLEDSKKYEYEQKLIDKNIKEAENQKEYIINQIKQMEKDIILKNNNIEEIKNEINNINQNIKDIENKKKIKKKYYIIKSQNSNNINKLNHYNEEIKNLKLNKEKILIDYDNEIKKLNEYYNEKKEKILMESVDNETKEIIEENQRLKEENNLIINSLNELPNLKEEYDMLMKTNLELKEKLDKNFE